MDDTMTQEQRLLQSFPASVRTSISKVIERVSGTGLTKFQVDAATAITRECKDHFVLAAPASTGKTLAYAIPLVSILVKKIAREPPYRRSFPRTPPCTPRVVVLTNSHLACHRVFDVFSRLVEGSPVSYRRMTKAVMGEKEIEPDAEILIGMQNKIHVLIDDGRLLLHKLEWLVIDEAASLFSQFDAHLEDTVLGAPFPRKCQTVLVDAKFLGASNPEGFIFAFHGRDTSLSITRMGTGPLEGCQATLSWSAVHSDSERLRYLVSDVFGTDKTVFNSTRATVIWCNTSEEVMMVARHIKRVKKVYGPLVRTLGGDEPPWERTDTAKMIYPAYGSAYKMFLVATDEAARGGDLSMFPNVINWSLPTTSQSFAWRVSRVGRRPLQDGIMHTYIASPVGTDGQHRYRILPGYKDKISAQTGLQMPMEPSRRSPIAEV